MLFEADVDPDAVTATSHRVLHNGKQKRHEDVAACNRNATNCHACAHDCSCKLSSSPSKHIEGSTGQRRHGRSGAVRSQDSRSDAGRVSVRDKHGTRALQSTSISDSQGAADFVELFARYVEASHIRKYLVAHPDSQPGHGWFSSAVGPKVLQGMD